MSERTDEKAQTVVLFPAELSDQDLIDDALYDWEQAADRGVFRDDMVKLLHGREDLVPQLRDKLKVLVSMRKAMKMGPQMDDPMVTSAKVAAASSTRFTNIRLHCKGGLGAVYRAYDEELHREVALKFINAPNDFDPTYQNQLRLEAEITGRLNHPNVVPIYGFGETADNRHFYAMRYIEGEELSAAIKRHHGDTEGLTGQENRRFTLRELLLHYVALCQTIAYAHQRGVVHRDIKPKNVMIGRYGETMVLDWGIAAIMKEEDLKGSLTKIIPLAVNGSHFGSSGSPCYMSQEQMFSGKFDQRTDIFSLGVTLYEIITGVNPFDRSNVVSKEFALPSRCKRGIPRPLEAICLKAMAQDAGDRYQNVEQLIEDIQSYLANEPVDAYQEKLWERVARGATNHKVLALWSFASMIFLTVISLMLSAAWWRTAANDVVSRRQVAEFAATAAARDLGNAIDRRLSLLEKHSVDQVPKELAEAYESSLKVANLSSLDDRKAARKADAEKWKKAQAWLDNMATNEPSVKAYSWFICLNDGWGTQIARTPSKGVSKSIGEEFPHREYFHGHSLTDTPSKHDRTEALTRPHLCSPFYSVHSDNLVAFSVPVFADVDGERRVIAVLGLSVSFGDLTTLFKKADRSALMVIYTGKCRLHDDDQTPPQSGLVMHHSALDKVSKQEWYIDLPPAMKSGSGMRIGDLQLNQREDSSTKTFGFREAAFVPVELPLGRNEEIANTHWLVVVQQ